MRPFFTALAAAFSLSCAAAEPPSGLVILDVALPQDPLVSVAALPPDPNSPVESAQASLEDCIAELRTEPFADVVSTAEDASAYNLAVRRELASQVDAARRGYLELIQAQPKSRFVPLAYLAFGELFRDEAASDNAKRPLAMQAYDEVLKFPPAQNPAYGVALLRRGDVAEDSAQALDALLKALSAPELGACAAAVKRAAQERLVPVYASVGDPVRAFDFFSRLAKKDDRELAAAWTVRLARHWFREQRTKEAALALEGMVRGARQSSDAMCGDGLKVALDLQAGSVVREITLRCAK